MPFICKRRADIQNGVLQITDFWPNASQRNQSIDPIAQGPRYISAPVTATVSLGTTGGNERHLLAAATGLAAYLIANVQVGAAGPALTPTQANTAAAALIAAMVAGATMDLAAINVILNATIATADLTANTSTGTVMDVLRVLSGATYTVPAGTVVQINAGADFFPQVGPAAWNAANFDYDSYKDILVADTSFYISLAEGQINGFSGTAFSYLGVVGPAIVVYDNTGVVL
jgi:hypothetical protein